MPSSSTDTVRRLLSKGFRKHWDRMGPRHDNESLPIESVVWIGPGREHDQSRGRHEPDMSLSPPHTPQVALAKDSP